MAFDLNYIKLLLILNYIVLFSVFISCNSVKRTKDLKILNLSRWSLPPIFMEAFCGF
jgi:hypothetical protein